MQVLRGGGIESEAELPFAALHQLVATDSRIHRPPARSTGDCAPAGSRPRGRRWRRPLPRLAGRLSLIAEAADRRPILCLVDDAHWLDDASADALVFVSRRLDAEPIAILFAVRDGEVRRFEPRGLPVLAVGGLDPVAAGELIDRQASPPLARDVRERLIEGTRGNPLALLELPSTLTAGAAFGSRAAARSAARRGGRRTRVPRARTPAPARDAGACSSWLPPTTRAMSRSSCAPRRSSVARRSALDAAEDAGLARVRRRTPRAAASACPLGDLPGGPALAEASRARRNRKRPRRRCAGGSASVASRGRFGRARRRACSTSSEQAAERARRRSAFAAASRAFERAAAFTPDEPRRARRLTAAAESAWLAGRLDRARATARARAAVRRRSDSAGRHRPVARPHRAERRRAGRCVRDALPRRDRVAPFDAQRALALLNVASVAASFAGDSDAAIAIARTAREPAVDQAPFALMIRESLLGIGALSEGSFAEAAATFRHSLVLEREIPERDSRRGAVRARVRGARDALPRRRPCACTTCTSARRASLARSVLSGRSPRSCRASRMPRCGPGAWPRRRPACMKACGSRAASASTISSRRCSCCEL